MVRVILVRHGQTEWNRIVRFRGLIDVPLNQTGLRQAEQVARAITSRHQVDAVYSSPMSRAVKTAEAIGRVAGVAVQSLPAIGDFSYGQWEGKTPEEVEAQWPDLYRLWSAQPSAAEIPGGESLAHVWDRVAEGVERMADSHPGETMVMVSHRMVCRVLACYLLGLKISDLLRVDLSNASISVFEKRETGWLTTVLNDTCHLGTSE